MRKIFLVSLILILSTISFSFAKTADEWVAEGDAYLEAHDTANAYQCYLNAYNIDPNNPDANFGLAILTLPHNLIDGGDTGVSSFLETNGISFIGNIYDLIFSETDVETNSTIPEIQNFIENHFLPYLQTSLTHLNNLPSSFSKIITGKMLPSYKKFREVTIQTHFEPEEGEAQNENLVLRENALTHSLSYAPVWYPTENWAFLNIDPLIPSNLTAGKWWNKKAWDWYDEKFPSQTTGFVESTSETVTTPQETFTDCIKLKYISENCNYYGYSTIETTIYIKEGIGIVKLIINYVDFNGNISGTETRTLTNYSIPSGTGLIPLVEGNQWTYSGVYTSDEETLNYTLTLSVTDVSESESLPERDVEIDNDDILLGKMVLNLLNGILNCACSYNLDADIDYVKTHNIEEILNEYPDFLTLKQDASDKLNSALTSFQDFFDNLIDAFDILSDGNKQKGKISFSLLNKSLSKIDRLKNGENEDFEVYKDFIRNLLSNLRNSFNPGGCTFDLNDIFLKGSFYSMGAPMVEPVTVDFSKFFTNPITRTNIEPLQFDENGELIFSSLWNFDQTLNGIFPDLTEQEFVGFVRYMEENQWDNFTSFVITGENEINISFWFNDISEITQVKIFRDTTPDVDTNSTLIAQITPDYWNQIFDYSAVEDIYYYKIYCYYSDGSYFTSPAFRVAKKLYVDINANGIQKGTTDGPYKYIGIGIEYANPGSEIYVAEGTYNMNEDPYIDPYCGLYLKNEIKLIGSCNPSNWKSNISSSPTIIDAQGLNSGFGLDYLQDVSIKNFIIKNAEIGIYGSCDNGNIENCVIYNCNSAGIYLTDSWDTSIKNCTIVNNGNGISGTLHNGNITNCIITSNDVGIYLWGDSDPRFIKVFCITSCYINIQP